MNKKVVLGEVKNTGRDLASIIKDMAELDGREYLFRCFNGLRRFYVIGKNLDVEYITEYELFYCDGTPVFVEEITDITILEAK